MDGLIDPFYVTARTDQHHRIEVGEFYLDQPVYMPPKYGLRINRVTAADEVDDVDIIGRTQDLYNHPPVRRLRLGNDEALVVTKSKKNRPVLVLAQPGGNPLPGPDTVADAHTWLCAPIYGGTQFSQNMRRSIRAYKYPNLFYLPECASPSFREGFVRFDHLQAIPEQHLTRRMPARLSEDAIEALHEWLFFYLTQRLPSNSVIAEYRQEKLAELTQ